MSNIINGFHKPLFLSEDEFNKNLQKQSKQNKQKNCVEKVFEEKEKQLKTQIHEIKTQMIQKHNEESKTIDEMLSTVEEISKTVALFKKEENSVTQNHPTSKPSLVQEIKEFKKEIDDKFSALEDMIKPQIQKTQKFVESLKKIDQFIEEKFKGQEKPPEVITFKRQMQMEMEKYQTELEICYQTALKLTKVERTAFINSMNATVGNDVVTKSKIETIRKLYKVGHFFNLTPTEIHEEVQSIFELNDMKNEFFDGIAKCVKDPKAVIMKEIEKLNQ